MKKIPCCMFAVLCLLLFLPAQARASPEELCVLLSPKKGATLTSSPITITLLIHEEAKVGTFKASLNGTDITDKFVHSETGSTLLVGPQDGLKVLSKGQPRSYEKNILWPSIEGTGGERDIDVVRFLVTDHPNPAKTL